ncbi:B3 domain-containing protein Os04g0386900-like isoform X2 [Salvia hispanica]|uniref:B3 domain-containing protein Os04g0386900-like isoform X2 n=1 Tax=Salvia hispanica TaxID=49212 RepID=UPI0020092F1A|nr:B3 domain-containing protein Os04g0386900-like isoform X2 [Salvia hispanica]
MSSSTKDKEVCEGNEGGDGVGVGVGWCLSGDKDFFDVILAKTHVTRPPAHILPKLPSAKVPLVLRHGDKQWQMMYLGNDKRPRFECAGWKRFVNDNNLKEGDACIFEVMESSPQILRLDVVIIRNTMDLPPALLSKIQSQGKTPETAIEL